MRKLPASASFMLVAVASLVVVGVVTLYSTSGMPGVGFENDPSYFVRRQAIWIGLGIIAYLIVSRIDYNIYRRYAVAFAIFSVILLAMVIAPEIGHEVKGARRWLRFGPIRFQPSELAKLSCIILIAWWMAHIQRDPRTFREGLLIPGSFLGVFGLLILVEPDFGTTILLGAVGLSIMFVGGARLSYLLLAALAGTGGLAVLISQNQERLNRIVAFMDPLKYAEGEGFQLLQALYAFVSGGAFGEGLGNSIQKHHYLPEAHTDFIYAILGEELGLRGTMAVVLLYMIFFICGIRISVRTENRFGKLMAFGITLMISLQAALNIGVVTGSLPTKGITLPFVSFGGSSMIISLAMVAILMNVALDMPEAGVEAEFSNLHNSEFTA